MRDGADRKSMFFFPGNHIVDSPGFLIEVRENPKLPECSCRSINLDDACVPVDHLIFFCRHFPVRAFALRLCFFESAFQICANRRDHVGCEHLKSCAERVEMFIWRNGKSFLADDWTRVPFLCQLVDRNTCVFFSVKNDVRDW